jgi:hypothetical protein
VLPLPLAPTLPARLHNKNAPQVCWLNPLLEAIGNPYTLWPRTELMYQRTNRADVYFIISGDPDDLTLKPGSFQDPYLLEAVEALGSVIHLKHRPTFTHHEPFEVEYLLDLLNYEEQTASLGERLTQRPTPALRDRLAEALADSGFNPGIAEYLYAIYKKQPPKPQVQPPADFLQALEKLKALSQQLTPFHDPSEATSIPLLLFYERNWPGNEFWTMFQDEQIGGAYEEASLIHHGAWEVRSAKQARLLGQTLSLAWKVLSDIIALWGDHATQSIQNYLAAQDRPRPTLLSLPLTERKINRALIAGQQFRLPPISATPMPMSLFFD